MNCLSREHLKWIHSLDLTVPVKSPKRDLSNGYAVAEILSRYYPTEIHMHSYDNGTGSQRRKQNWSLLKKFFVKYNFPVTDAHITDIMYNDVPATLQLVDLLYTVLTNRTIKHLKPTEDPTAILKIPSYAMPTASTVIQNQLRTPQVRDEEDYLTLASNAQHAVEDLKALQQKQQMLNHIYNDAPLPASALGGVARMTLAHAKQDAELADQERKRARADRAAMRARERIERIPSGVTPFRPEPVSAKTIAHAPAVLPPLAKSTTTRTDAKPKPASNHYPAYSHTLQHGYTLRSDIAPLGPGRESLEQPPLEVTEVDVKVYGADGTQMDVSGQRTAPSSRKGARAGGKVTSGRSSGTHSRAYSAGSGAPEGVVVGL